MGTPRFTLIIKGSDMSCNEEGCSSLTLGFLNCLATFEK